MHLHISYLGVDDRQSIVIPRGAHMSDEGEYELLALGRDGHDALEGSVGHEARVQEREELAVAIVDEVDLHQPLVQEGRVSYPGPERMQN